MCIARLVIIPIAVCCLASSSFATDPAPRLHESQVVTLADAYAKQEGYRLRHYTRSKPHYEADIGEWSVMYEPKGSTRTIGDDFSVYIHDRTKKPSIIPGR